MMSYWKWQQKESRKGIDHSNNFHAIEIVWRREMQIDGGWVFQSIHVSNTGSFTEYESKNSKCFFVKKTILQAA